MKQLAGINRPQILQPWTFELSTGDSRYDHHMLLAYALAQTPQPVAPEPTITPTDPLVVAIAAAIIGAGLAWAGGIIGSAFQRKHEQSTWLRDQRSVTFVDLLALVHRLEMAVEAKNVLIDRLKDSNNHIGEESDPDALDEELEEASDTVSALYVSMPETLAATALYFPTNTFEVTMELIHAIGESSPIVQGKRLRLVRLMRSDIQSNSGKRGLWKKRSGDR